MDGRLGIRFCPHPYGLSPISGFRPIKGYDHVQEGDYVVLTVSDIGGGISAVDLDKIFEPFYTMKKVVRDWD